MRYSKLLVFAILAVALVFVGCSQVDEQSNPVSYSNNTDQPAAGGKDRGAQPIAASTGAYMTIAWPFVGDNPDNWTGDQTDPPYTAGGTVNTACRGWVNSHSWAEQYARDLNRSGGDYGRHVHAGFDGKVVIASYQSGYGNNVVIYDASRHVAVRYAHLSYIAVSVGDQVDIRQYIGDVGNSGTTSSHLHLVGYENINDNYGNPIIPTLCDSEFYSCILYFMC